VGGYATSLLQRRRECDQAKPSTINVIGGCHYVAIATSLDGRGFENASTTSNMCDFATEVAYSDGILGITVTDRDGHERASGANGQPCSGFP
jgi:hypothetical protein